MSKVEKPTTDLKSLCRQHLEQLSGFGVTIAPSGTGQTFDLPQVESVPDSMVRETAAPSGNATAKKYDSEKPAESSKQSTAAPKGSARQQESIARIGSTEPYPAASSRPRQADLKVINDEVASCTKCSVLAGARNCTVFGVGNPQARLVLIGEAPGEQEDKTGEPFVGAAGQLLDKMLAACGLNRQEHVYILNAVKCRPPQNRNPKPDELENCWGYAQRQLEFIQPEFICCLGSVAARTVLQTTQSVGRLRKQFHRYRDSKVIVTYHPSYLLRTTSAKKHAWEDMKLLMREMGIDIPKRN
ncbi:MAG: uracil-DNA glycosylase [Planctomycetota bacterium]